MPILASRAAGAIRAFGMTVSSGAASIARDLYFRFNSLLLKGNTGDPLDSIKQIPPAFNKDLSDNNLLLTLNNTAKPSGFNPYSGNYYSTYFDGSSSVDYALSSTGAAAFGTGDFTIELWVYPTAAPNNNWSPFLTIGTSTDGQEIRISQNINGTGWGVLFPNSTNTYAGYGTLTINQWHHIAFVRNGTSITLYRNGLVVNTWTNVVTNFTNNTLFRTGSCQPGYADGSYVGYIHGLRIVKGVAVYTAAFTPSSTTASVISGTTFLGHCQPYYRDLSANNLVPTVNTTPKISQFVPFTVPSDYEFYGSSYFDGTSYITASVTGGLGSGDFTVEGWVYFTATPNNNGVFHIATGSTLPSNGSGIAMAGYSGPKWHIYVGGISTTQAGNNIINNQWYHFAMTRSAGSARLFINGTQVQQTYTDATDYTSATFLAIGGYYSTGYLMTGYVSDFRIVKGSALYTSTFTPSSQKPGVVSNTSLLSLQYKGSLNNSLPIDNSNINSVVTKFGNTSQGTFSPYHSSWSMFFNGSSDYLTLTTAPTFGTGAFTVEFWMYATSLASVFSTLSTSASGGLNCRVKSTTVLSFDCQNTSNLDFTVPTLLVNTWYHIVFVRNSSSVATVFVDGVRSSTGTQTLSTNYSASSNYVGLINSSYFPGYLSNLRVYVGTAVYDPTVSSFTAPTKALTSATINNTSCSLLVCNDGIISDKSRVRTVITVNGTPKPSMMSPFSPSITTQNQGYYSTLFPTASWLLTPAITQTNIGTNDFTVEFWFYMSSAQGNGTIFNLGQYTNGIFIRIESQNYSIYIVNTQVFLVGTAPLNTWVHLALVRRTGSLYLWANGVQLGSIVANNASISPTAAIMIGASAHATSESFNGYVSNLRLVVGNGLYTAAFTPPTTPLTAIAGTQFLGLQNSTQVDSSPNQMQVYVNGGTPTIVPFTPFTTAPTTVTLGTLMSPYQIGGSMYFDGSGDYLTMPANTNFALSGDFTIEMYVFPTVAVGSYRALIATGGAGSADQLVIGTDASIQGIWSAGVISGNGVIPAVNTWTHLAVSRTGTSVYFFLNGVQQGTTKTSSSSALSGTATVGIAYRVAQGDGLFTGYIAGLRVIRGKALYTAAFMPPTTPPTPTPETVLLINGNNPGIFDSTGGNNLETISGAKVSTAIKKFNSGSIQLNGSTDYLMIPGNPLFNSGTSDFTVEAWVYLNSIPTSDAWPTSWSSHMVLIGSGTPAAGDGFNCIIGQTKLLVHDNADTGYQSPGTHNMVINQWYHLAFVRSSNTMIFYVNGSSLGSVAFSASLSTGTNTYIGCETTEGAFLNGYIDDLRFSRVARYTGPYFPVPTTSAQETGPSETEPGTSGVSYVAGDGLSAATAGASAAAIKAQTGTNADGAYWINLPTVGPTQVYCIMNSAVSGGGWMMAMKATRGTTFPYSSTHWNTVTTLNTSATNRADGDAKFNTMNYFEANDIMALFPDITTNGGSLGTNPFSCWSWLETSFNGGTRTTLINFFNTTGTYNTGTVNSTGNYGGRFIRDAKTFSGWQSGVFSSQPDIRFYGFNYKNEGLQYGGTGKCRWGFGWNENGEGLYSTPASLASGGATGSNDVWGGIGMDSGGGNYSAGDVISCCNDTTGINRSARVEIYIR
jgi:hypothetical protein